MRTTFWSHVTRPSWTRCNVKRIWQYLAICITLCLCPSMPSATACRSRMVSLPVRMIHHMTAHMIHVMTDVSLHTKYWITWCRSATRVWHHGIKDDPGHMTVVWLPATVPVKNLSTLPPAWTNHPSRYVLTHPGMIHSHTSTRSTVVLIIHHMGSRVHTGEIVVAWIYSVSNWACSNIPTTALCDGGWSKELTMRWRSTSLSNHMICDGVCAFVCMWVFVCVHVCVM